MEKKTATQQYFDRLNKIIKPKQDTPVDSPFSRRKEKEPKIESGNEE